MNSRPKGQARPVEERFLLRVDGQKKLNAPYRSGPSKVWIKVKNPKAPAATRATDGTF